MRAPRGVKPSRTRWKLIGAISLVIFLLWVWVRMDSDYRTRVEFQAAPTDKPWTVCKNDVTATFKNGEGKRAIEERRNWGKLPRRWLHEESYHTFDAGMVKVDMMKNQLASGSGRGFLRQKLEHPFRTLYQYIMGRPMGLFFVNDPLGFFAPFDYFGPPTLHCPDMRQVGVGDEEKHICWTPEYESESCVVFSLGCNNQWTFEESIVADTRCRIHTFDCTVTDPRPPASIRDRDTFYPLCLADHRYQAGAMDFYTYQQLLAKSGGRSPHYLKIDIEGFEFEALVPLFAELHKQFEETGVDHFPTQVAIEVHYQAARFHLDEDALLGFANYAFHVGGYVVAHRRDNWEGYHAAELLLVRVNCQSL